jgi:hypothetical protein
VAYRVLKVRFNLDDDYLEALKDELIYARRLAVDEADRVLVWTGAAASVPPTAIPAQVQDRAPLSYTPKHLTDKILTTRSALEGERKQVTVLFCDIVNSTPLAARLGPEAMHTLLKRTAEDAGCDAIFAADQTNTLLQTVSSAIMPFKPIIGPASDFISWSGSGLRRHDTLHRGDGTLGRGEGRRWAQHVWYMSSALERLVGQS